MTFAVFIRFNILKADCENADEYTQSLVYRSLIGLIAYITQKTRSDILFHTNTLSSKQNNTNVNDTIMNLNPLAHTPPGLQKETKAKFQEK